MLYIFKTNIKKQKDVSNLTRVFKENEAILHFNFDLEDRDKILRVKTEKLKAAEIMLLMDQLGHQCEELQS